MNWPTLPGALPWLVPTVVGVAAAIVAILLMACRRARGARVPDAAVLRNDVAELAGELEDFARRIDTRVAERIQRLGALLAEADKREQELHRLIDAAAAAQKPAPSARNASAVSEQVLALAAQGLDSIEIARRLQRDVGEVELMLNLHRSGVASKA